MLQKIQDERASKRFGAAKSSKLVVRPTRDPVVLSVSQCPMRKQKGWARTAACMDSNLFGKQRERHHKQGFNKFRASGLEQFPHKGVYILQGQDR